MDIIKNRKLYFGLSLSILLIGLAFMIFNMSQGRGGFNLDTQFTGGTSVQADIGTDFTNDEITEIVKEVTGETSPQVQRITGTNSVMIKTRSLDQETRTDLVDAICDKYSITGDNLQISDVSATISREMQRTSVFAVLIACTAMLIYITFRFRDFKTGSSAVLALVHDVAVVLAFYAIFRIPLNDSFIAAMLTILGYSINATIIIFDRIRENKKKINKREMEELINRSVNQTLRRSVYTSLTTLMTITSLYIFGVQSVKEFALPIVIGIICGTYSSVFLSGSIWYTLSNINKKPKNA